jgi:cation-transporting ATPase E
LISSVTIGIPAFFLALGPNRRRYIPGFLGRVLRFAVPAGIVTGAVAYLGYEATGWFDSGTGVDQARSTAALIVLIVSLWTLMVLARPFAAWKLGLVVLMALAVVIIVSVPALGHDIFLLDVTAKRLGIAAVLGAVGAVLVEIVYRVVAAVHPDAANAAGQ